MNGHSKPSIAGNSVNGQQQQPPYAFGGLNGMSHSNDNGYGYDHHPHHDSPPPPPMLSPNTAASSTSADALLLSPSGFRPVDLAGGYQNPAAAGGAWQQSSMIGETSAAGRRKSLSAGQAAHLAAATSSSSNGYASHNPYHQPSPTYRATSPNYPFPSSSGGRRRAGSNARSPGGSPEFRTTLSRILAIPRPTLGSVRFIGLCTLWYASSAMSSNTGKAIMTRFRYPVTLTIVQFFFVAAYCWIVTDGLRLANAAPVFRAIIRAIPGSGGRSAAHRRSGSLHHLASSATIGVGAGSLRLRRPTRAILMHTWPMAVFQVGGHIFSSMAISRVPVSTVHTIKALSPLFTVLAYALVFGVKYSPATYLSLLPLTLGVMLATCRDLSLSNALGLICAFGSTLVFVSSNIVFKKLMPSGPGAGSNGIGGGSSTGTSVATGHGGQTAGAHGKLDKINLLFYSSGMAFVLMIPIWAWSDMPALIRMWLEPATAASIASKSANASSPSVTYYFWLNGTVHFAQNYLAFAILSSTSPVTYSIASLVKRIAVICLAIIWFKQTVHPVQAFGIGLTGLGLWMYNNAKRDVEKGEKKVRRMEAAKDGMLPLTRDDHRMMSIDSPDSSRAGTPEPEFMSLLGRGGGKDVHASPRPEYSDLYDASQSITSAYRPNGFEVPPLQPTSSIAPPSSSSSSQQPQLPTRLPNGVGPYPSSSSALPSPPASNSSPPQSHAVPLMSAMPSQQHSVPSAPPKGGARRRQSNDTNTAMRNAARPSGANGNGNGKDDDQRPKEVAVL